MKGVLLINLGSPESLHIKDIRKYLAQFLMDKRIIDLPYIIRFLIVYLFILPFRPEKSAEAYRKIWEKTGSPLIENTRKLKNILEKEIKEPVEYAMRYGLPSIKDGLNSLVKKGVDMVYVIPLFPHYAMSSFETCVIETKKTARTHFRNISLKIHPPFYDDKNYIEALFETIKPFLKKKYDHILFSYHGIPIRHLKKTDPTKKHCVKLKNCCRKKSQAHDTCYKYQSLRTSALIAEKGKLKSENYTVSYQSRFGRDSWLSPFTEKTITDLARSGKKNILVTCPSFTADCLETLEEIGIRAKENFINAGGKSLTLVPALNYNKIWVGALKKWIQKA
ncbi:MAG: ferrochelatase [Spirochaetia bacterium]|nr:ferrochelatase [Spirochaetia bacterium]